MKKENFNLKLKIFFLEERLAVGNENRNVGLLADNIDLKVKIVFKTKLNILNTKRERTNFCSIKYVLLHHSKMDFVLHLTL